MSSRDDHIEVLQELDRWLEHIQYEKIEDDIPDAEKDVVLDVDSIFVKNVPANLQKQFTVLCKAFPELKNEDIRLVFKKIPMTMQARPDIWPLLIGKKKYLILINTERGNNGIILEDIPFNGQVGVIAHEFCHVLDYVNKSVWQIIKTGIMYLSSHKRAHYEKATDFLAIKKGFGLQLNAWTNYILEEAPIADGYRKTKEKYYLSPSLIEWLKDKVDDVF